MSMPTNLTRPTAVIKRGGTTLPTLSSRKDSNARCVVVNTDCPLELFIMNPLRWEAITVAVFINGQRFSMFGVPAQGTVTMREQLPADPQIIREVKVKYALEESGTPVGKDKFILGHVDLLRSIDHLKPLKRQVRSLTRRAVRMLREDFKPHEVASEALTVAQVAKMGYVLSSQR